MTSNRREFIKNSSKLVAGSLLLPTVGAAFTQPIKILAPKKIFLKSAWATSNIGDIGHTPGTLRILEEHYPEAEVTLWPSVVNAEVEAMLRKRFPKVRIVKGNLQQAEGEPYNPVILKEFQDTDLFLYNSGMHFNFGLFNYDWNSKIGLLTQFLLCQELGKPYGLYGHSFDKFAEPSPVIFRQVLNKAAFIYCRDSASLAYLKEHQVKAPIMEFGPDGCFGIDTLDEPKGLAYLKANGLKEKEFLTVIIRSHTPKPNTSPDTKDKLNPPQATPEQKVQDQVRFEKINALITAWVRQTRKKVLIAPEVYKEMAAAKTMVFDQQPPDVQKYIVVRDTFWNADEALSVYRRAHTVVGMEPHSLIMALAVGVPVIHTCPFTYGKKGWMFKDIGLGEWLFDIDKAPKEDIIKTLLTIHKDYKAARQKAAQGMAFVKQRQQDTVQTIRKVVV
ncbi:MAG: polysaccharide pyruvyl transferase family protein [Adhaeribacter sp.]